MESERIVTAAGGIVWRSRPSTSRPEPRVELLVVHRPSYDDWTFPKGKTDPGESLQTTAVREIAEEAGIRVRLGHPLGQVTYPIAGGTKSVAYWCARAVGPEASTPFAPNREVDEIRWVGSKEARSLLTYAHDTALLDNFQELRAEQAHKSRTLIVLRHGKAVPRSSGLDDVARPLTSVGDEQARSLMPVLSAYGVRRVVSSPAMRCTQTVEPYARSISTFLEVDDRLSESSRSSQVQRSIATLLDRKKPVVLCTHRPTLPWVYESIGIAGSVSASMEGLAPGEGVVIHHRKGVVLATEMLA